MEMMAEILNVVAPVFLMIAIGYLLGLRGLLAPDANQRLSRLVFYVAAPALLFRSAAHTSIAESVDLKVFLWAATVSVVSAFIVYLLAARGGAARRGVIAQGAFRSNMVFVGLPVITNAYGDSILGPAAVLIGFMVPVYNVLAVLVLALPHQETTGRNIWKRTAREVALNPLIISTVLGLIFAAFKLPIPVSADRTLELLARIAMPLALLVVGASLDLGKLRVEIGPAALVSLLKLVIYPAAVLAGLKAMGVSGNDLYFPVLIMAAPTAVVSHIMAKEMKGDEQLAGAVVIGTTLFSMITISLWLLVFRLTGW